MDWMGPPVSIDAASAAVIAAGMKAVARADGEIHVRELALIESFEAQLPTSQVDDGRGMGADVRDLYLRSIIMVALADGRISDAERQVILNLAAAHGFAPDAVESEIMRVKRVFLSTFSGVTVFRDAVRGIARELGLPDNEVES